MAVDRLSPEWARQRRRYRLGQFRAEMSNDFGCFAARTCMHPSDSVVVHIGANGTAHTSGLMRCGSVGLCPVCAPTIRQKRAGDIDAAAEAWLLQGGETWLATFTIPHGSHDDPGELLQRLGGMWRRMTQGTGWRNWRSDMGMEGQIKALEVTFGRNGFHPHLHVLFFAQRRRMASSFVAGGRHMGTGCERLAELWRHQFDSEGIGDRFVPKVSVDVRKLNRKGIGVYLNKVNQDWGAGAELARSDLKSRSVTPAQLLELAHDEYRQLEPAQADTGEVVRWQDHPDARWMHLWESLERGTKRARWIEWGKGLRARAAVWQLEAVVAGHELTCELLEVREQSDQDAARGRDADHVVASWHVPPSVWLRFRNGGQLGLLLQALISNDGERYGCHRVVSWVDPSWRPGAIRDRSPPLVSSS